MHLAVLIAGLFLFLQAWRGWQRGVVRQAIQLLALCCAWGGGYYTYHACGSVLGDALPVAQQIIGGMAGFFVGLVIYCFIKIPSAFLFKETHQQNSGLVRFFYGLGGAVGGMLVGSLVLWGVSFLIIPLNNIFFVAGSSPEVTFQESAQAAYKILYQARKMASDPPAMARFLQYPDIRKILQTQAVSKLLSNPQFMEAASHYEILPLLLNSQLYQTLGDPEVEQAMKNVDLKKALDYAFPTQN